jgi:hypothetical protein
MTSRHLLVLALILPVVLAGCAACPESAGGSVPGSDPSYLVQGPARTDAEELEALMPCRGAELDRLRRADVLFVGEVVAVQPSAGIWSGIIAVTQVVRYRVIELIRGEPIETVVTVAHPIVGPPVTERDEPELSHAIWRVGARLLIGANLRTDSEANKGSSTPLFTATGDQVGPLRAAGSTAHALLADLR